MKNQSELLTLLQETFSDQKIDNLEKATLFEAFQPLSDDQRAFVRNRAFDIVKQFTRDNPSVEPPYKWLEQVVKSLDNSTPVRATADAYFSPGDDCIDTLLSLIGQANKSLQICVFTISDNRLRDAIFKAHNRGIRVKVITDNEKMDDIGSDIAWLMSKQVPIRIDQTRHHMHHKFMLIDDRLLVSGSFNWTLSASRYNHENIIVMDNQKVIGQFSQEFSRLWQEFSE